MQELEKEVSFKEIILLIQDWATYIFTKWKILLIAAIIGGLIGLVYSWNQKVTYTATLIYVIEDGSASNNQNGSLALANQFGFGSGTSSGGLFAASNLTELIKTKLIFYEVLKLYLKFSVLLKSFMSIRFICLSWGDWAVELIIFCGSKI